MEASNFDQIYETKKLDELKFNIIFETIKPLYAQQEITKCISEDNNFFFTKCSFKILDQLINQPELNDAFVKFFFKTIESYHKSSVCGTKTAILFSITLLRRCNLIIISNGLDSGRLSKNLCLVFKKMIELLESKYLFKSKELNEKFIKKICRNDHKISIVLNNILKKCSKFDLKFKACNINFSVSCGKDLKKHQFLVEENFNFRVKKGLYIRVDDCENFLYLDSQCVNALVFDSNLSSDFVHLGYNKQLKAEQFYNEIKNDSFNNQWYDIVTNLLIKNKIKVLILKDSLQSNLSKFCDSNKILIFKYFNKLEHLKNYSLSYISDFDSSKILNMKIEFLKNKSKYFVQCLNGDYVKLSFPTLDNFMTLIIENRIDNTQSMIIDSLKHNIQRLENVINEGYFRGAGQTERMLANDVKCLKYSTDEVYFECAKNIWEGSLMDMCYLNEIISDQESELIDDAKSKIKAWQIALFINNFFLNCDFSILNK